MAEVLRARGAFGGPALPAIGAGQNSGHAGQLGRQLVSWAVACEMVQAAKIEGYLAGFPNLSPPATLDICRGGNN